MIDRSLFSFLRFFRSNVLVIQLLCFSPVVLSAEPPIKDYGNESLIGAGGNDLLNQLKMLTLQAVDLQPAMF